MVDRKKCYNILSTDSTEARQVNWCDKIKENSVLYYQQFMLLNKIYYIRTIPRSRKLGGQRDSAVIPYKVIIYDLLPYMV